MATKAEERVRDAVRSKLKQAVDYHGRVTDYGTVVGLDPVCVELHDAGHTIGDGQDGDLLLGHAVKLYIREFGLEVADDEGNNGDTLVLSEMKDGKWAAVDVLHDKDVV